MNKNRKQNYWFFKLTISMGFCSFNQIWNWEFHKALQDYLQRWKVFVSRPAGRTTPKWFWRGMKTRRTWWHDISQTHEKTPTATTQSWPSRSECSAAECTPSPWHLQSKPSNRGRVILLSPQQMDGVLLTIAPLLPLIWTQGQTSCGKATRTKTGK